MINNFKESFCFFDGAMGTMLQDSGLKPGELPEEYNITKPNLVKNIHKKYIEAGSNIISTNTFGANDLKLKNSPYSTEEVISAAVNIAKEAISELNETCPQNKYIALDIGPTGSLLSPLGTLSFEEAYHIFKKEMIAGEKAGADLILIETMTDLYELKAAILAAKENTNLPVFCTMTFQENNRTFIGTSVSTFVSVVEGLGVDVLGVNCSLGPKQLQPIVDELVKYSSTPIMVKANAGLPIYNNNKIYYDIDPIDYSKEIIIMAKKGVQIFGGCCGTTPVYIKEMIQSLEGLSPLKLIKKHFTTASSGIETVFLGDEVKIIGERINPTGKKLLKKALLEGDLDYIINEAITQEECGSDILDINVGLPDINELEMMKKLVKEVQSISSLPLQIDSSDPDVIEEAVRIYNGKAIINSVNGKKESMEKLFPIVKKYGTLVIALTLDENGIPKTANERLEITRKIVETAKEYGIQEESILIDPLVLTASAEQESVMETLQSIPMIKSKYGVKIVLGTSNVSFGLPNRKLLNKTYLSMALAFGLDAPITDSTNEEIMDVIRAFKVLSNQDYDCKDYISTYSNMSSDYQEQASNKNLKEIIMKGLKKEAKAISLELLAQHDSLEIINNYLIPALDIVGDMYEEERIFLPQLIQSAETAKIVFDVIKEDSIKKDGKYNKIMEGEKILLATVKGDIHDIGKNIVKLLLDNYGYKVIDLGKDVDIDIVTKAVLEENIPLVGLSALMTTTVKNMEDTIKEIKKLSPQTKIMVGGAVLTQDYAKKIAADYYSKDARGAVDIAKKVFKDKEQGS